MESRLYALLAGGSVPVYPVTAPQDAARPYMTYQRIATEPNNVLDGTVAGRDSMALVQVSIFADRFDEAIEIARDVRVVMSGYRKLTGNPAINMVHQVGESVDQVTPTDGSERPTTRVLQDYQVEYHDN